MNFVKYFIASNEFLSAPQCVGKIQHSADRSKQQILNLSHTILLNSV